MYMNQQYPCGQKIEGRFGIPSIIITCCSWAKQAPVWLNQPMGDIYAQMIPSGDLTEVLNMAIYSEFSH